MAGVTVRAVWRTSQRIDPEYTVSPVNYNGRYGFKSLGIHLEARVVLPTQTRLTLT